MTATETNTKRLTTTLPADQVAWLESEAEKQRVSMATVIRWAIDAYIKQTIEFEDSLKAGA